MLFLSYAEEDSEQARKIVDWFAQRGIKVYYWEDPERRGGRFVGEIERELTMADAFLALVSPHFVDSPWCHRETELAILREVELQRGNPGARFIRVLKIAQMLHPVNGFLSAYDSFDLTSPGDMAQQLDRVAAGLETAAAQGSTGRTAATPGARRVPSFRNRDDELDAVFRGITNTAGPHFWLVIAPPQLGKTWFIDQLAVRLREETEESANWSARRVDLRDYPEDVRGNVPWLLGRLFSLGTAPSSCDEQSLLKVAAEILARGRPHLCLLDSAELLTDETVMHLRSAVAEIYHMVHEGNNRTVRVAFVAASRLDGPWRPVTRPPRLNVLQLSEFKSGVVLDALRDLAGQMDRSFGIQELQSHARQAYQVSEGLPALLALCLQWIQQEQWLGLNRLSKQSLFEDLARNYVEEVLLGSANLFGSGRSQDLTARLIVKTALHSLAPYRLFTLAHVRYHVEGHDLLPGLLADAGWSVERLWAVISRTAVLSRPQDEPWQEVQGAIRRLLFRYFYPSDEHRAAAHARARRFAGSWTDGLTGNDQVTGLVECLWHEAAELGYKQAANAPDVLRESASRLVDSLKPSPSYTESELRRSAALRMRNNEEFQDTFAYAPGLFDQLMRIVDVPEEF
jgi:TIR domain